MLTSIKIMIRKKYRIILSFLTSQQRSNVALIKVEQQQREREREREKEREGERGREREREGERENITMSNCRFKKIS